jgi:hypothetical protein
MDAILAYVAPGLVLTVFGISAYWAKGKDDQGRRQDAAISDIKVEVRVLKEFFDRFEKKLDAIDEKLNNK